MQSLILFLKFTIISLIFCSSVGAYSKAGTTYTTDGSQSDVAAAVADASVGDTVSIPSGTFEWATGVAISKNITVQGAGKDSTVIQKSAAGSIFSHDSTAAFRITAIELQAPSGSTADNYVYVLNKSEGFRIDNCRFNNTTTTSRVGVMLYSSALSEGQPSGLIDGNVFVNCRVYVTSPTTDAYNPTMAEGNLLGTANTVYIENNVMDRTGYCSTSGAGNVVDSQGGMSFVFRYNDVTNAHVEVHAPGSGDTPWRGGRYWEVYSNTFTHPSSACWDRVALIRSGTGVIFRNNNSGGYDSERVDLDIHAQRDGSCDGSSPADGNTEGESGWPCRDQIGRATDAFVWTAISGVPSQASEPAYLWSNTGFGSTTIVSDDGAWIVQDRDFYEDDTTGMQTGTSLPGTCTVGQGYFKTDTGTLGTLYKCTSTDTWTSYYAPYTCPHPLAGAGTCSTTVAGTAGYTLGSNDLSIRMTVPANQGH